MEGQQETGNANEASDSGFPSRAVANWSRVGQVTRLCWGKGNIKAAGTGRDSQREVVEGM